MCESLSSKVLGMKWDVDNDSFHITVDIKPNEAVARKDMLSVIASMYDPLGLVSPCVVVGKMLFQDATRLKLGWRETIPSYICEKWKKWAQDMCYHFQEFSFPRCIKPSTFDDAELELHTFCDASEKAYGCCSYMKCVTFDQKVITTLVMSKGRISPMHQVTIPRLELQAAVIGAQVHSMLLTELDVPIIRSYLYSDSQIVLAYIKNSERRFKVYVENRVSVIRKLTHPDQWRFVPGTENPADYISRGMKPQDLMSSAWKEGPQFLKECHTV